MSRLLVEVTTSGTYMVTNLTANELARLDAIQRACTRLDVQLFAKGDGYLFCGFRGDTAEEPVIRVENASLAQGERMFRAAYEKLVRGGMVGGAA